MILIFVCRPPLPTCTAQKHAGPTNGLPVVSGTLSETHQEATAESVEREPKGILPQVGPVGFEGTDILTGSGHLSPCSHPRSPRNRAIAISFISPVLGEERPMAPTASDSV